MTLELTVWVSPFTSCPSIYDAIGQARSLAQMISTPQYAWTARLLVPTHYNIWSQSQCRQNLPKDMLTSSPADVTRMRAIVNGKGLRFGTWGVPVSAGSATVAASYAAVSPTYCANFEPSASFWAPGDDPAAVDAWWGTFWNSLPDQEALDGRVTATVVPNGWGLGAFTNSLPNLAAGCNALALEVYGGPNTASEYVYPSLWPSESFAKVRAAGVDTALIPILARANLSSQIGLAAGLGHSQVQVWCI